MEKGVKTVERRWIIEDEQGRTIVADSRTGQGWPDRDDAAIEAALIEKQTGVRCRTRPQIAA